MDDKAKTFNRYRSELTNIAYGMLGSLHDAKDIVQDGYLRWTNVSIDDINNPEGYLKTIIARLCIDRLRSAKNQREEYYGPWLPEPIIGVSNKQPDSNIELHDELTIALLHLLENLTADQRAIYLLHDTFGYTFDEVAEMVDKNAAACRKAAQRARQRIQSNTLPVDLPKEEELYIIEKFIEALQDRDMDKLRSLLTDDAILYSDGGGKAAAAPKPIVSAKKVSKFLLSIADKNRVHLEIEFINVNNRPGFVAYIKGKLHSIWTFSLTKSTITKIFSILNPDKLPDKE